MKPNSLITLVVACSVASCALPPPTSTGAIREAKSHVEFQLRSELSSAYRALVTGMKACEESGGLPIIGAPTLVEGEMADDKESATISRVYLPWSGRQVFRVVTLRRIDSSITAVKISDRYGLAEGTVERAREKFLRLLDGDLSCK